MSDVICINDTYSQAQLDFWRHRGVKFPIKDKIYTIREIVRHTNQEIGIRVQEINNPRILVKHSVLNKVTIEPSFKISRFTTLSGKPVKQEELEDVKTW